MTGTAALSKPLKIRSCCKLSAMWTEGWKRRTN